MCLAVVAGGFVLLNLLFILYALLGTLAEYLLPEYITLASFWFGPTLHLVFLLLIGFISWLVFRTQWPVLIKSIYLSVPIAVALVTVGMFLNQNPVIAFLLSALICIGVLYYFYHTKKPWLYSYAVGLTAISLAIFSLLGGQI